MLPHLNLLIVELDKPFVFLDRGRVIERKLQYQRVRECTKPTLKFLWMNIKWHHEFNNDRKQLISELLQCGLRYKRFKNANGAINFCYNTYKIKGVRM
ncbi:MAG TPA: hypothetical protein VIM70_01675 [Clostridium sp.]|uniref:hypothetical protein n=1 Tax=Clostridium sp. TaxID=1506 RepID=UPI002F94E78F